MARGERAPTRAGASARSARRRFVLSLCLGGLIAGSVAAADARAECPPAGAAGLYENARRAFEEKRYEDSVDLLRRAYDCDPNPVYLADVARSYEEASEPRQALDAWRKYLAVVTDDRVKKATEGRISALAKVVEDLDRLEREKLAAENAKREAEAAASAQRAAESTPTDGGHRVATAAWIVAGGGVLGVATGAVLGAVAMSKKSSANNEPDVVAASSFQSDARAFAQGANWCFAIGGGLAGVGLAWIVIDLLTPASPPAKVDLRVDPTGARLLMAF